MARAIIVILCGILLTPLTPAFADSPTDAKDSGASDMQGPGNRQWCREHRDECRAQREKRCQENPDKCKEKARKWCDKHPEFCKVIKSL